MLKNRTYDVLKSVAQIWLPAGGTLYFALAQIWHLPSPEQVVGSVVAVDAFLGAVLGLSTTNYNKSDEKYDGMFAVDHNPDGGQSLRLKSVDYEALNTKDELVFKVVPGTDRSEVAG